MYVLNQFESCELVIICKHRYNKSYINYIKWNYQIEDILILNIADISCFIVTLQIRDKNCKVSVKNKPHERVEQMLLTVPSFSNKDKTTLCLSLSDSIESLNSPAELYELYRWQPAYHPPTTTLSCLSCLQAPCGQI